MSLMRSPTNNGLKCSSQPDLSKLEGASAPALSSIITRKRKHRDQCDCEHEIKELRSEMTRMTTLMEKLVTSQEHTLHTMRDSISEISSEMKEIKVSTSTLVREQNNIKNSIVELDNKFSIHEEKISFLESGFVDLKTPSSSDQSRLLTNEETIRELHERFNREKNVIIVGLSEQHTSHVGEGLNKDEIEVISILSTIVADCSKPVRILRLGKYAPEKCRKIKVCFSDKETAMKLLRNKSSRPNNIKIFSDQTPSQMKFLNDLKVELARRNGNGEQDLIIKYVKGTPTIIKDAPKNCNPPQKTKIA